MMVSYWHTPDPRPLEGLTLPQLIDERAKTSPDQEAYVVRMNGAPREAVTFGELKSKTESLAAGLLELGLKAGDFVLITGITCLNWILVDFACTSVGIHTIRCRMSVLTKEGLLTITNRNNVKAIFYHPGENKEFENHLQSCIPDAFQSAPEKAILCNDISTLKYIVSLSETDAGSVMVKDLFKDTFEAEDIKKLKLAVKPDDILSVYMTSGSTGFPKATPFTHFAYLNQTRHNRFFFEAFQSYQNFFNDRSLSWAGSFVHLPLVYGNKITYVHPLTNASDKDVDFAIQVIHEEKVTCALFLQYMMIDVTERFKNGKAQPFVLDWIFTGGEVLQEAVFKGISNYTKAFRTVYGTTECNLIATNMTNESFETTVEYAGFIEHGYEVKIVDDDGVVVPMGETGEIVIRSPFSFKGYLQEEAKGMSISKDGWIKTDDAGLLDGGYLKVFGRKSQVISRGITLTYPTVVERIMIKFPGVSKVVVVGVPDKRLGQNICACVIPVKGETLTSDDLIKCFQDTYQTDEGLGMTPAYFMFLDEFPTVNAKMDRQKLKQMAVEKYQL